MISGEFMQSEKFSVLYDKCYILFELFYYACYTRQESKKELK